jgi:hypothetical protein
MGYNHRDGIPIIHCANGVGVDSDNTRNCLALLRDSIYGRELSMERDGRGRPMVEQTLKWLRGKLAELNMPAAGQSGRKQ